MMSSIIQQLKLWDQLIEQRIKFEELMHKCNSLPQEDTWLKLAELDKDGKLLKYQKFAEEKLLKLFEECGQFEKTVEQLNPNLLDKDKPNEKNDDKLNGKGNSEEDEDSRDNSDDEQMQLDESDVYESDLNDEESDLNEEDNLNDENDLNDDDQEFNESDNEQPFDELNETNDLNKLIEFNLDLNNTDLNESIDKTEIYLSTRYERLKSVRNDILNFWFEKTRFTLRGGKLDKNSLDAFEQSTVKSIDHLLLNRLKLIKRTQLKRGNYEIIGKKEFDEQINSELVEKKKKEIYDSEIFDDSDFYHQLLRELVNNLGASNLNNNTTKVNPKWLKLMRERFKSNKYVDTKATKARKIRYKVHNLLVNFMTPMTQLNHYDDEQHSNLISSIFGNTKNDLDCNFDSSDSD